MRLGERLRKSATQLNLVPPRTEVVRTLSTGLAVNFVGLGATIVGLQATTGLLFAKTLTVAAQSPFAPGVAYNPVLALDIFLVQVSSDPGFLGSQPTVLPTISSSWFATLQGITSWIFSNMLFVYSGGVERHAGALARRSNLSLAPPHCKPPDPGCRSDG